MCSRIMMSMITVFNYKFQIVKELTESLDAIDFNKKHSPAASNLPEHE
jgi:hypothetical protein